MQSEWRIDAQKSERHIVRVGLVEPNMIDNQLCNAAVSRYIIVTTVSVVLAISQFRVYVCAATLLAGLRNAYTIFGCTGFGKCSYWKLQCPQMEQIRCQLLRNSQQRLCPSEGTVAPDNCIAKTSMAEHGAAIVLRQLVALLRKDWTMDWTMNPWVTLRVLVDG